MTRLPLLLLLALGLVGACSSERPDVLGEPADGRLTTAATVLESPTHGPELCLGPVADSLPPQCGGVPVVDWDWAQVEGEESANGTTWGGYRVVGRYDGEVFRLTEPAVPVGPGDARGRPPVDFTPPCPEPAGGWRAQDPARAGQEAADPAVQLARRSPGFAALWVDDRTEPDEVPPGPDELVLVVGFTGELAAREAELREVWGGPLCVFERSRTEADLQRVQDELIDPALQEELGLGPVLSAGADVTRGIVEVGVAVADDAMRARVDERYGRGVVELVPALVPVS